MSKFPKFQNSKFQKIPLSNNDIPLFKNKTSTARVSGHVMPPPPRVKK